MVKREIKNRVNEINKIIMMMMIMIIIIIINNNNLKKITMNYYNW